MIEKISIDYALCNRCKRCIEICPRDCFRIEKDQLQFDGRYCHDCGHCISICPKSALSHQILPREDFSLIEDVLPSSSFSDEQMYFLLKSIRSTRSFLQKAIDRQVLEKLIDIVRYAPTGHHSQNVQLTVIQKPEVIEALKSESSVAIRSFLKRIDSLLMNVLARLSGRGAKMQKAKRARARFVRMLNGFEHGQDYLFHGAPVIFVFHANKNSPVPADNCNQAATYVRLLAHAFGLGSCFIGYLIYYARYNRRIREILAIPPKNEIYQVLILGYPKSPFRTFVSRKPSKVNWL